MLFRSALGSITTNKASGGDGIPAKIFQILKDDAVKVLHSVCQQIWKTQQWTQDWKTWEPLPDHAGESPLLSRSRGEKGLELWRPWGFSPEARRGSQGASRAAPGERGLPALCECGDCSSPCPVFRPSLQHPDFHTSRCSEMLGLLDRWASTSTASAPGSAP